jgi:hypothetical protein
MDFTPEAEEPKEEPEPKPEPQRRGRNRGADLVTRARIGQDGISPPRTLFQALIYLLLLAAVLTAIFFSWNWSSSYFK